MEEEKKLGLHQRLNELEEYLKYGGKLKKKKLKKFKMPLLVKLQEKKILKKNKLLVFLLRTNRKLDIKIAKIENGMIFINENYHQVAPDYIYLYKKMPCIILPEWDLNPFGIENYKEAIEQKRIIHPQNIILRAIEAKEAAMTTKKLSGKAIIFILVGGVIIAYLMFAK